MVNQDLVRRKLSRLIHFLDKLRIYDERTLADYQADDYLRFSAERLIQLIVECAVDINNHVVIESGQRPPEDYRSSFVKASQTGLITTELASDIQGSAGLRNLLVHEYSDVDHKLVFESIRKMLRLYKIYVIQVEEFLEKTDRRLQ